MKCPGCLKEGLEEYCSQCRKALFDGKKVSPYLTFNSPYNELSDLFLDHTKKISISGVQVKYSLKLQNDQLVLTDRNGEYILKPIPTGQFKNLDQAPANEHLTMQLARQFYKMNVPANAIIFFSDRSAAYLVRRFDKDQSGNKLQQEDFAQIAQMTSETHGKNYKYDFSYEEIGGLIKKFIPTYTIELEKFYKLILFNYVISNGDAHLKNFSAIRSSQGDYILTPVYDLLCTRIHAPSESDMALNLFANDEFTEVYEAYGFYTYQDFFIFGQKLGLIEKRMKKILNEFLTEKPGIKDLIYASFLNKPTADIFYNSYLDKIKRLNMK